MPIKPKDPVLVQTYQRMLRSARDSLESANHLAMGRGADLADWHSLQAAATQAAQAAKELNQLVGFVQACDDLKRMGKVG